MICINPHPTFDAIVRIPTPSGHAEMTVTFAHKGRKALSAWRAKLDRRTEEEPGVSDCVFLAEIMRGWQDVQGRDGTDVPYSEARLDTLLDEYPMAARAIYDRYLAALTEAKEKN